MVVFNNTGFPMQILEVTNSDEELKSDNFFIDQGEGRNLKLGDHGVEWHIIAMIGGCRVVYELPSIVDINYPWEAGEISHYIKVQVEPDFGVHLIPETAEETVDVLLYSPRQDGGFPIYPDQKDCG